MYIKTFSKTGTPLELPLDELEVFSTCPCCGAEVPLPDVWELMRDNADFDPCTTAVCCDRCSSVKSEAEHIGEQLLRGEMTPEEAAQRLRALGVALNATA